MMRQLYVKGTGIRITGTLEQVPGCALVLGFNPVDGGEPEPEWEGTTEMWWDDSETQKDEAGRKLYVGEDGEQYTIDQLELA